MNKSIDKYNKYRTIYNQLKMSLGQFGGARPSLGSKDHKLPPATRLPNTQEDSSAGSEDPSPSRVLEPPTVAATQKGSVLKTKQFFGYIPPAPAIAGAIAPPKTKIPERPKGTDKSSKSSDIPSLPYMANTSGAPVSASSQ